MHVVATEVLALLTLPAASKAKAASWLRPVACSCRPACRGAGWWANGFSGSGTSCISDDRSDTLPAGNKPTLMQSFKGHKLKSSCIRWQLERCNQSQTLNYPTNQQCLHCSVSGSATWCSSHRISCTCANQQADCSRGLMSACNSFHSHVVCSHIQCVSGLDTLRLIPDPRTQQTS